VFLLRSHASLAYSGVARFLIVMILPIPVRAGAMRRRISAP